MFATATRLDQAGPITPEFLARIVAPYKPTQTDYLKAARMIQRFDPDEDEPDDKASLTPIITTVGRFEIPHSCYIQSTGHFNAVEYLICFNQLAYTTVGHLVATGMLAELPLHRVSAACRQEAERVTIARFFDKQLSSMLILKTETRFTKVIDASDFQGELKVQSLFYRRGTLFGQLECTFTDAKGGHSEGSVLLAYPLNFN